MISRLSKFSNLFISFVNAFHCFSEYCVCIRQKNINNKSNAREKKKNRRLLQYHQNVTLNSGSNVLGTEFTLTGNLRRKGEQGIRIG